MMTKVVSCVRGWLRTPWYFQESRKHYNQLEEARKQQHARKLKLEAQEVALGERDHVTATLGDSLLLGKSEQSRGEGMGEGGGGDAMCTLWMVVRRLCGCLLLLGLLLNFWCWGGVVLVPTQRPTMRPLYRQRKICFEISIPHAVLFSSILAATL